MQQTSAQEGRRHAWVSVVAWSHEESHCDKHDYVSSSHLLAFVYSLAIGLLVGGEREWSNRGTREVVGIRTFALLALVGTVCVELSV